MLVSGKKRPQRRPQSLLIELRRSECDGTGVRDSGDAVKTSGPYVERYKNRAERSAWALIGSSAKGRLSPST